MKTRRWLFVAVLLLLSAACEACGEKGPKVIHHPRPDLSVNVQAFYEAGCTSGEHGDILCGEDSQLAGLDCDELREPSDLLGGLEPSYPLAVCRIKPFQRTDFWDTMDTGYHLYTEGCMAPSLIRYVVYRDGQFQVIGSWLELQEVFAPIESPDEALSFAIALTGYSAYYGLEVEPGLTYFVDTLEDTHVVDTDDGSETPGGYRVHLFYYELCGCGPHDTVSAKVFVTRSGQISSVERESVFKDPQDDGLCID